MAKKKRSVGRKLLRAALLAGVGVVIYRVYSTLNPTEDPWAAAYWEDVPVKE